MSQRSPNPRRIPCPDEPPSRQLIEKVRSAMALGGLVAIPTETVYGLAARADIPEALERLNRAKDRDPRHPLTWHVGSTSAIEAFPGPKAMARRLAERYWPGPLTLVLPGHPADLEVLANEGWTGVRFPAHRGTAGILAKLPFPVAATSANRHGEDPLTDADRVEELLGDDLGLILDGGPSRLSESSSVLFMGPGRFEVGRGGLLEIEALRATAGLRLGFVCTGNTCRSPMAEVLARNELSTRLAVEDGRLDTFGFEVHSFGVAASGASSASPHAAKAVAEKGLELTGHTSRAAVPEEVGILDRVYAMTHPHLDAMRASLPPGKAGHLELLDPEGGDVSDPMGGSLEDYRRCRDHIRRLIELRASEWV